MYTLRTYETRNNTYYFARSCKTTYEQQQERKAELLYMATQKGLGLLFIILSILPAALLKEPKILLFTGIFALLGVAVTLTKDHVIG